MEPLPAPGPCLPPQNSLYLTSGTTALPKLVEHASYSIACGRVAVAGMKIGPAQFWAPLYRNWTCGKAAASGRKLFDVPGQGPGRSGTGLSTSHGPDLGNDVGCSPETAHAHP